MQCASAVLKWKKVLELPDLVEEIEEITDAISKLECPQNYKKEDSSG